MGLDRCLTEKNGVFTSTVRLQESEPLLESIVAIQGVGSLQFYSVDVADLGGGLLLGNGRYANPITDNQVAINTSDIALLKADNPNNQTGTAYTLALGDENKTVWMNNAAANVLTIPLNATEAFAINTLILIMMEGAGVTSVTAVAGVTLNTIDAGTGDLTQFNGVTLVKRAADTWIATPLTVA